MSLLNLALIASGAAVGACLRYMVGLLMARLLGLGFPWGTLAVNVIGSFAMGLVAAALVRAELSDAQHPVRLLIATGLLGGFTTFSAFSLEIVQLWDRGAFGLAVGYVAASLVFGIAALVAGLQIVRMLPE